MLNSPHPGRVFIGKLARTQGLAGGIRLLPFFTPPERFADLDLNKCVFYWNAPVNPNGMPVRLPERALKVEGFWFHQQYIVLEFEGLSDIDAVAPLSNGTLSIDQEMMWLPDENEYREYELVNMRVLDDESGSEIGTVLSLEDGSAHDYLKVKPTGQGKVFLVPFVKAIVPEISRERQEIRVRLPQGLTVL